MLDRAGELVGEMLSRRTHPRRWLPVALALLLTGLAFIGGEPWGFLMFMPPAILCGAHALRPTALGWCLVTGLSALLSAVYALTLASDIVLMLTHKDPYILTDLTDSVVLITTAGLFVAVTIGMLLSRPAGWPGGGRFTGGQGL